MSELHISGMQPRSLFRGPEGEILPNGMTVHSMQDLRESLKEHWDAEPSDFAGELTGIKIYVNPLVRKGFYRLVYPMPYSGEPLGQTPS